MSTEILPIRLICIGEQDAIYDGDPSFPPLGMIMNLLNYHSVGGSEKDLREVVVSGEMDNPRRYKIRVIIEAQEYVEANAP